MVLKFKCLKCSNCCRNFREDMEDTELPSFEGGPIISINNLDLPLYYFEKERLTNLNSDINVMPALIVFDRKSHTSVVLKYSLEGRVCPFLENNICSIYKERPIICKLFPCPVGLDPFTENLLEIITQKKCEGELSAEKLAKELNAVDNKIKKEQLFDALLERYGDSFINRLRDELIINWIFNAFSTLEKQNKIKLAKKGYNIEYLKKGLQKSEIIDVSEFLAQFNINLPRFINSLSDKEIKTRLSIFLNPKPLNPFSS